jgi:AcrR family transcriptional regulator
MTIADAVPRPPGRPRSSRADEVIIDAVLDLLAEGTAVEALAVEAIAARAGVGKATIYRRWPGKEELLRDALRTLKESSPVPAGRTVRDDLVTLLTPICRDPDSRAARVMSCLLPGALPGAHRSPERHRLYRDLIEPRRDALRQVLRRGAATGELRDDLDVELAVALLTGPVLMQRLLRSQPALDDEALPERVVDAVLAGLARPAR